MRYGVALALFVGLFALPASASQQTEAVTLKVGQTIPLKTVFDKRKTYTVTVSGLVTLTLKDGSLTNTYDPFYGAQDANCTNAGASVYLQIKDASGNLIDFAGAGRPPCRKTHRYTFQVNDAYPPAWELHGKATAYITLQPDPAYWTASGSFKLSIEPEPAEPVARVLWGMNARKKKSLGVASLSGRGLMETMEIKEGGLADRAYLLPATAASGEAPHAEYVQDGVRDRRLQMVITGGELIMQGAPGSATERFSVRLVVEVVESNLDRCAARSKTRRGARGTLTLVYYPRKAPDTFVSTRLDLPCGVDESWTDEDSDATIRVSKLTKKK